MYLCSLIVQTILVYRFGLHATNALYPTHFPHNPLVNVTKCTDSFTFSTPSCTHTTAHNFYKGMTGVYMYIWMRVKINWYVCIIFKRTATSKSSVGREQKIRTSKHCEDHALLNCHLWNGGKKFYF